MRRTRNIIVCPTCLAAAGPVEQKCCSHAYPGRSCVRCGAVCVMSDGWACLGSEDLPPNGDPPVKP